ncbi:hypothetical protein Zmor_001193 [Zophobas morio]|uniref:Phospholipid scramblase n=1 Tax=Zophobas morio TaxID=2755281 RepID=A0AA38MSG0_9CUCU|nr:hypothetical protein Zmor_001193 [Zophobas morio]
MSITKVSHSGVYEDPPPPYESLQAVLNQPMPYGSAPEVDNIFIFVYAYLDFTNLATPSFVVACPPGLENLRELDQLTIENEPTDFFCCCSDEPFFTYSVINNFDQILFSISPVNRTCTSYDIQLFDSFGNPVVLFQRCRECCSGLRFEVIHTLGTLIGTVELGGGIFSSVYIVGDANDQTVFKVKRITTAEFSPNGIEFRIKSAAESVEVGKIIRVWTGRWSAHHLYKIIFPRDLAAEMKVALLAAWYMIEEIYQQYQEREHRRRRYRRH